MPMLSRKEEILPRLFERRNRKKKNKTGMSQNIKRRKKKGKRKIVVLGLFVSVRIMRKEMISRD